MVTGTLTEDNANEVDALRHTRTYYMQEFGLFALFFLWMFETYLFQNQVRYLNLFFILSLENIDTPMTNPWLYKHPKSRLIRVTNDSDNQFFNIKRRPIYVWYFIINNMIGINRNSHFINFWKMLQRFRLRKCVHREISLVFASRDI